MTWNYRVIQIAGSPDQDDGVFYQIHEVYYAEDGSIEGWSADAMAPMGEDLAELEEDLSYFKAALEAPILKIEALESGKEKLVEVDADSSEA